ncbi:hypothetical protein CkaCkLH20_00546 [Colletotrichum karsti]|uniref:Branched-chain-amino-acid aminotransferase n=1 Tax=Colletotrichum karsti TaxID=1095194 RepID=A0A9P6LQP4_9PEZI|nr:uncharacterized protein CkaCkLH20_00546 [Colletotrichum karsti]KAF9882510.1 hypothetical protein CkaCkLH20_00546 [Colletotrichum karsti]
MPTASVLQYATECFEGIKAYRGYDGKLRLFRLELNCQRMLQSSARTGLPAFDPAVLKELICQFAAVESRRWLPTEHKGESLYLRPTHIGTTPGLGLQVPRHSTLFVVATRTSGFQTNGAMTLVTSPKDMTRAWPGGFGNAKLGANYGPTLVAHADAISRGFDQVLWLFGEEEYATEAGASNLFVVWRTREGELQLVTAGLNNQTILEGVTRRSIIELVQHQRNDPECWNVAGKELEPLHIVERDFSINEIRTSLAEGRLVEAFASGTAYFIAPIRLVRHRDEDLVIPCCEGETGLYAALIKGWLGDIVFGRSEFRGWASVIEEAAELVSNPII